MDKGGLGLRVVLNNRIAERIVTKMVDNARLRVVLNNRIAEL